MTAPTCPPSCRPDRPCPWCDAEAMADREARPTYVPGYVPDDLNGLPISLARYANARRERELMRGAA